VVLGQPNLWVRLEAPVEVRGLFGIRRISDMLGVAADDPEALSRALRPRAAAPA
jgi:hypothetical protein